MTEYNMDCKICGMPVRDPRDVKEIERLRAALRKILNAVNEGLIEEWQLDDLLDGGNKDVYIPAQKKAAT